MTNIEKDFLADALLRHNYLPFQRRLKEELPPIFSTEMFKKDIANSLSLINYKRSKEYQGYDQVEYNLTRFNNINRILSIPHPVSYSRLCISICENWEKIDYICNNKNSQIKPMSHDDGRIIIMNGYNDPSLKFRRTIDNSFGKFYRVNTDISNFFHSIYSHAIPWALVGLTEAKKNTKNGWYNDFDYAIRQTKRNETQGIAIGPATSSIISEILLDSIDKALCDAGFDFIRYVDDYTCYCETEEKAQEFIRTLSKELARYKLTLNIRKTLITKLPIPINDDWTTELHTKNTHADSMNSYQVIHFLDFAVRLSKAHPESSVLKYAVTVISKKKFSEIASRDMMNYVLTLAFHQPALLPALYSLIVRHQSSFLGSDLIINKLVLIVEENAKNHRSDGMCWAIFYLCLLKARISEETLEKVIKTNDIFSILALYYSGNHNERIIEYCHSLDKEDLYGLDRHWILLYQLFFDDVLANPYKDGAFELLKQHEINFLLPLKSVLPNYEMEPFDD